MSEPTFPTDPLPEPWSGGYCACAFCLSMAEAWAWRVADTMPDSAQSRRDSEADARQFYCTGETRHTRASNGDGFTASIAMLGPWLSPYALVIGERVSRAVSYARSAAHAARRACPGLRGEL